MTKSMGEYFADIADEVYAERHSQDEKWPDQMDRLIGTGNYTPFWDTTFGIKADEWKEINDARASDTGATWDGILLEEVYEALAEGEVGPRREELVQVAAVAFAMIECIDRAATEVATEIVDGEAA